MTIQELHERYNVIKEALNDYCLREFDCIDDEPETIEQYKSIGIAVTESDWDDPIQVTFDLETLLLVTRVNGEIIEEFPYESPKAFAENLGYCSFEGFCESGFDYAADLHEEDMEEEIRKIAELRASMNSTERV